MGLTHDPEVTMTGSSPEEQDNLLKVIILRLCFAIIPIAISVFAGYKTMTLSLGYPDYVFWPICVPSAVIAVALMRRQRWAMWAALAYDALFIPFMLGAYITQRILIDDFILVVLAGIPLFAFLYEGRLLLEQFQRPRWRLRLYVVATLMMCLGVAALLGQRMSVIHRAAPILAYADKHWLKIPGDLIRYDNHITTDKSSGYTLISFELGYPVHGRRGRYVEEIHFVAKDLGNGRWRIPAFPQRTKTGSLLGIGSPMAVMMAEGVSPQYEIAQKEQQQAEATLRTKGFRKHRLVPKGTTEDIQMLGEEWISVGLSQQHYTELLMRFHSEETRTDYYVHVYGEHVFVQPQHPIDIPEK